MPAKGGAFFGFAIVVAAALITWGIIALVNVANDDSSDDGGGGSWSGGTGDSELQEMLNDLSPGDTLYIPEGTHEISLTTAVAGTEDQPITITCEGSSRNDCILKGEEGRTRVVEVLHSWYIIDGFTIDGENDDDEYKEQLVFVQGIEPPTEVGGVETSVTGVTIQDMVLRNAGKECVRLRYFVTNSVVQDSDIGPCGIYDFQIDSNDDSNGEGVYIGTALNQIDDKGDVEERVDECSGIVVMNNDIDTQGSEGVDIKEGSFGNLVYENLITGRQVVDAGGISLRGDRNMVTGNAITDGEGTCVRIGGDSRDGVDYGQDNEVYENSFDGCRYSSIKVNEIPQIICGNSVDETNDPTDDELYEIVRGDAAASFPSITEECDNDDLTDISVLIGFGDRDFVVEEDDDESPDSIEEDEEENDDETEIIPGGVVDGSYTYVNCYNNNDNFPLELFDHAAAQDDASLSVEKCIALCVEEGYEFAGIQDGDSCWCGHGGDERSSQHFNGYGTGLCTTKCTGSEESACGGPEAFSLYEIEGDGGVGAVDEQGDDDGGMGGDEGQTEPPSSSPEEDDDPTTSQSGSVTVVEEDDELPEETTEEDDDPDAGVPVVGGVYVGCYIDNDAIPVLEFSNEGDTSEADAMTPDICLEICSGKGEKYAGLQDGDECWCGSTEDYGKYGTGTCTMPCEGDPSKTCGGDGALSIWEVQ